MLRKTMAFHNPHRRIHDIIFGDNELQEIQRVTIFLYTLDEFKAWIDEEEVICSALGYIATDEMRSHYRIHYFNKMIHTAFFQEAATDGPMAKIETGEEMEELYMRTHWNSVVIAQLKVIDWTWKTKSMVRTLTQEQMDELEKGSARTLE